MKNNNSINEINSSKTRTSQNKYFAMFDKHIPNTYSSDSTILLFDICNEGCIEMITRKNPDATYVVYDTNENEDTVSFQDTLPLLMPNIKFIFVNNEYDNIDLDKQFEYNLFDMKFDCIIMNPPYQRNLHLKILEKAITQLTDQGKCVCLAPSPYTKYKDSKNFNMLPCSYEKINPDLASKIFNGIQLQDCLLISEWQKNKQLPLSTIISDFVPKAYSIIKKLKYTRTFNDVNVLNYSNEEFFVPLKLMTARWDKNKNDIIDKLGLITNGKVDDGRNYKSARTRNVDRPCGGIPFNSEIEARNFISSCRTTFFKFIVEMQHTNSRYVLKDYPFMDDYTEPWTDERFYKYFNITPDEQKIIEETMAKYK